MDIDANLRRLSALTDHPRLAVIDDAVMAHIHARRGDDQHIGFRLPILAALAAVAIGAASTRALENPMSGPALAPFAPLGPLAPSTLLATDR
ncbi:hypothetical protein EAH84_08325 [Sphingomonas oligophenolica]|uniref:Uncharacterized protein n=2 Tax=Sphingomonas oligophenolica TaxID=301154 RepID=A0A502CM33_9SPHN|nr:hypothetical protein EAH84_08325 [Sphingomonas oligophenolica]